MDIEGAETAIPLDHFSSFDKILLETHSELVGESATNAMLVGLQEHGFQVKEKRESSLLFARNTLSGGETEGLGGSSK